VYNFNALVFCIEKLAHVPDVVTFDGDIVQRSSSQDSLGSASQPKEGRDFGEN
jgi:hypothetical protein